MKKTKCTTVLDEQVIVKMTKCSTVYGRTAGHCENDQVHHRVWTNSLASCAQAFHGQAVPDSTGT